MKLLRQMKLSHLDESFLLDEIYTLDESLQHLLKTGMRILFFKNTFELFSTSFCSVKTHVRSIRTGKFAKQASKTEQIEISIKNVQSDNFLLSINTYE